MAAGDILLDIVGDLHRPGRTGGVSVGADGDELHIAPDLAGPDDIRHEHKSPPQHADEQRILALQVLVHLGPQLPDALGDLLLRVQHLQNILIHHALFHTLLFSFFSVLFFSSSIQAGPPEPPEPPQPGVRIPMAISSRRSASCSVRASMRASSFPGRFSPSKSRAFHSSQRASENATVSSLKKS